MCSDSCLHKPRLLDLFCGAGGAAVGYELAGFEVVGVDIEPQPRYPFEFHQADALSVLGAMVNGQSSLEVDVIHASPPCQSYSKALRHMANPRPELIEDVRLHLELIGVPWVIENVPGAPLPNSDTLDGRYGIQLCGTQFGLFISRHRLFEASVPLNQKLSRCRCSEIHVMNPYNAKARMRLVGDAKGDMAEIVWRNEMGVSWMNRYEGREAIPPAYTEFIGEQLMAHVREKSLSGEASRG